MHETVDKALGGLQQVIAADTDFTVNNFELMERVNINAFNKFRDLADSAGSLDKSRDSTTQIFDADINKYVDQVDQIVRHVDSLEAITRELDEWSKELQVKTRRFASRGNDSLNSS